MTNELTADSAASTTFFDKHRINLATAARRDGTDAVRDVHGFRNDADQLNPSLSWCGLAKYFLFSGLKDKRRRFMAET